MYPVILIAGADHGKTRAHFVEIHKKLAKKGVDMVLCFNTSPFTLPIHNLSNDSWSIAEMCSLVEKAMIALKVYHTESAVLILDDIDAPESGDVYRSFVELRQYLIDCSDIVFTVGVCDVSGIDIKNATDTAVELVGKVMESGL